jgi:hypothetical protein
VILDEYSGAAMYKFSFIFFTAFLIVSFACGSGFAQARKKEKITVFEVPTTGKIMDVEYRPEFDEWWVKCREGDHISVYSYEPKTHSWGKVLFVSKKPEDPEKRKEKTSEPSISEKEKASETAATDKQKSSPEKQTAKPEPKKWWDPLNILKEGEKLIIKPWSTEGAK